MFSAVSVAESPQIIKAMQELFNANAEQAFTPEGVLRPMPAAWWAGLSREAKQLFGHIYALYSFPTIELIELLAERLQGVNAIEIGAGNGGYCKALGIPGTDSFQQIEPKYRAIYEKAQQPIITYGAHVEKFSANHAVKRYNPRAVVAAWVTHKWTIQRHELGGNEAGVDEHDLLARIDDYYFIGNTKTHAMKPLFHDLQHGAIKTHEIVEVIRGDLIQSRASGGDDFLVHIQRVK